MLKTDVTMAVLRRLKPCAPRMSLSNMLHACAPCSFKWEYFFSKASTS